MILNTSKILARGALKRETKVRSKMTFQESPQKENSCNLVLEFMLWTLKYQLLELGKAKELLERTILPIVISLTVSLCV